MTSTLRALGDQLSEARAAGHAVGAFNVYDLASMSAVLDAAQDERAAVILAVGERYVSLLPPAVAAAMARALAAGRDELPRPGLHLDHAQDPATCRDAIAAGFTSVMFDGSDLPFEENVHRTRGVVDEAHQAGVAVEGELGGLAAGDHTDEGGGDEVLTDPDQAAEFVARTGVDALAVSVGTVHGMYRGEPFIDLERLAAIADRTSVPLVLHGGSGVPAPLLREAIARGVAKVNVNTEVSLAAIAQIAELLERRPTAHLSELSVAARTAMTPVVADYVRRFRGEQR
ncbi:MAG TPA: class II fructose-bisphosphate aldolase [Baekduia sp.]|nr:class II fructose-bisphosphate aldolase [Baekduia sp.]